jgi:hypothetical protein
MPRPADPTPDRPGRDPAAVAVIRRARRAVEGVLAGALGLVLVGALLGDRLPKFDPARLGLDPERLARVANSVLFGLLLVSVALRRALASRAALRDPRTRARQFLRAQVCAAFVGALAAPLGLALAVLTRPTPRELAPFWVAALGTVLLAYPRGYELDDFDEPLPGRGE